ncbi:MAG TPA: hypothetical protein VIZ86_16575 [Pseudomonas sp.]
MKWIEGAPERLAPGMLVVDTDGDMALVGDIDPDCISEGPTVAEGVRLSIARWAWLVTPYEREWLADMERLHRGKKP